MWSTTQSRYAFISVLVSIAALVISPIYSHLGWQAQNAANETAIRGLEDQSAESKRNLKQLERDAKAAREEAEIRRQQMDGIQRQLEYEGPVVRSEAWYTRWTVRLPTPYAIASDQVLLVEQSDMSLVWLNITVINDGRFKATVTGFDLQKDEESWAPIDDFECLDTNLNKFVACAGPTVVDPQELAVFRVPLNNDPARRDVACSKANDKELKYFVETRGAGSHEGVMRTRRLCTANAP